VTRELQEVDDMVAVKIVFCSSLKIVARCRKPTQKALCCHNICHAKPILPFSHHSCQCHFAFKKFEISAGQAEDVDGNGSEEIRSGFGSVEKDLGGYHHCPAAL